MPKETRNCETCAKPVSRYPSQFVGCVYCSPACRHQAQRERLRGDKNPCWRGGRYVTDGGYVMVRRPGHPRARQNGYVLEHILVAEEVLGRRLAAGERVHHLNHDPADNRPANLKVYPSNGEHLRDCGHHRKRQPPCFCGVVAIAKGYCSRHYAQVRRTGRIVRP